MSTRPATTMLHAARKAETLAHLLGPAREHLAANINAIDGWPTRGDTVHVSGTGGDVTLNAVEAAAEARLRHSLDLAYVDANIRALHVMLDELLDDCHRILRGVIRIDPLRLCDPSGRDGSLVPLADGGWADWTCREAAIKHGLCDRHYHAERRWRAKNGLKPREADAAGPTRAGWESSEVERWNEGRPA